MKTLLALLLFAILFNGFCFILLLLSATRKFNNNLLCACAIFDWKSRRLWRKFIRDCPVNRDKVDICPIEIEQSKDFKQIVVARNNPAIQLAKSKRTSYTIAKGLDIVEVKDTEQHIVGKISKSDVILSKGTIYKLNK